MDSSPSGEKSRQRSPCGSISTCERAKPDWRVAFGETDAYDKDTVLTYNSICSPTLSSLFAVGLGHVILLIHKLWVEVTCVTFRTKCKRAGTWSAESFSCHGNWGAPSCRPHSYRMVRLLLSVGTPEWPCRVQHTSKYYCMCTVSKKQNSVCLATGRQTCATGPVAHLRASQVAHSVNNPSAMQETQEIWVQSLGQEDPLEEENDNPLQYSCLENSMGRSLVGYSPWGRRVGHNWATSLYLLIYTKEWNFCLCSV